MSMISELTTSNHTPDITRIELVNFLRLVGCGLVIGGVTGFISQWIYWPIIFPAIEGAALLISLIAVLGVFKDNPRPLILLITVLIASLLTYGAYQTVRSLLYRNILVSAVISDAGAHKITLTSEQIDEVINESLIKDTGYTGITGLLLERVNQGTSITTTTITNTSSFRLQGLGVWLYWFIEIVIIVTLPLVFIPRQVTRIPKRICGSCRTVFTRDSLGKVHPRSRDAFFKNIENDEFENAGNAIIGYGSGSVLYPCLDVFVEHCEKCQQSLAVLRVTSGIESRKFGIRQLELSLVLERELSTQGDIRLRSSI